jgi:hypothetical protein
MTINRNILLRRIAALLLFALLLMAFAALFFFKITPDNRSELNQRGHRVLTQQVQNFLRKDQDLHNIIENARDHFHQLADKLPPYDRLNANLHYDTTTNVPPGFHGHLLKTDTGVWLIAHHRDTDDVRNKPVYLTVKMKDFADPLFAGRDDVFSNYLLLLDSNDSAGSGEGSALGLSVLYQQSALSASARLNADTTKKLTPNSDQSGTFQLSMAGQNYVAFFSRFEFHLHHLILVGLIEKDQYDATVSATPPLFLPLVIIFICLAMITLPFLKVFLLSPHETINSWDVLKMAFSFYAGGVAFTIIVFYFFLSYVTSDSLAARLRHFSRLVREDVEKEIRVAGDELEDYNALFDELPRTDSLIHRLSTDMDRVPGDNRELSLDNLCFPDSNILISRLFWLDTTGKTIAKWSPFRYPTPFTRMNNYVFYQLLLNKPANYDGIAGVDVPVLYPGKSNLTDEFQTFIALRSNYIWPPVTAGGKTDTSGFIVIADMLRATILPVIPPGFGFSIIDDNGNVLVDGDPRKSLGGNLFEESEENKNLIAAVHFDKSDWQFPLDIRGLPYYARVTPIAGQPLHLVCYYSRDIVRRNVDRMMHFSIQTLVLLWCVLGICLLLSTFHQWRPVILKFNLEKIEWIRPSSNNKTYISNIFTWLLWLTGISIAWFVIVGLTSTSLAPLFYLSLLLPFYAILVVQIFHKWFGIYTLITITVLSVVIIYLNHLLDNGWSSVLHVVGFQALAWAGWWVAGLRRRHQEKKMSGELVRLQMMRTEDRTNEWKRLSERKERRLRKEYFAVLYLSILLISVLPALGILNYAFFAEKVQFKKQKLDAVATAFGKRSNYLLTNLFPSYKKSVQQRFDTTQRKKLLFSSSIYLTDRDTILQKEQPGLSVNIAPTRITLAKMPDALYSLLMDKVYFAPFVWGDATTISNGGSDGHGRYSIPGDTAVEYDPGRLLGDPQMREKAMVVRTHLQKPHWDLWAILWPVGVSALLLMTALILLAAKLVKSAINHLFLMEIVGKAERFGKRETSGWKSEVDQAFDEISAEEDSWMPEVNQLVEELRKEDKPISGILELESGCLQTDRILALTDYLKPVYADIFWKRLSSDEERYILYDFATDRYTNYKNSAVLYRLISKGVLVTKEGYLDVFSLSFRQYLLSLSEGDDANRLVELQRKYRLPGTWQSVRVPAIAILLVLAVFLFATQPQVSTFLAGLALLATSLTTVIGFVRSSLPDASKKSKDEGAKKAKDEDVKKTKDA